MRSGFGAARREETQMDLLFSSEVQRRRSEPQGNRRLARVISALFAISLTAAFWIGPSQVAAQTTAPSPTGEAQVQLAQPPGPGQSTPPITLTLKDALDRASKNDPLYLGAVTDAKNAH
jgi:hypothetical protein